MKKIKKSWDVLSQEERRRYLEELIHFFNKEMDEEIEMIAGEELLDFFMQSVGVAMYNKGVDETKTFFSTRCQDFEIDAEILKK